MRYKDRFRVGVVRDGLLYVDGECEPYHRDPELGRRVEITGLQIISGFKSYGFDGEPPEPMRDRVRGPGKLLDGDRLSVAGSGELDAPLWVSVVAAPDETDKYDWRSTIGMLEEDDEFNDADQFFIEAYVPAVAFEKLVAVVRAGRVRNITLRLRTTLWTRTKESFFGHEPAILHLAATDTPVPAWRAGL